MTNVEKFGAVGFGISKSEFMGANIFFTKVFCFDKRKKSDAAKIFSFKLIFLAVYIKPKLVISLQKILQIVYSDCPFQNLFQTLYPV